MGVWGGEGGEGGVEKEEGVRRLAQGGGVNRLNGRVGILIFPCLNLRLWVHSFGCSCQRLPHHL